jgi:hypothetical protein
VARFFFSRSLCSATVNGLHARGWVSYRKVNMYI